jgi:hypothetical protein
MTEPEALVALRPASLVCGKAEVLEAIDLKIRDGQADVAAMAGERALLAVCPPAAVTRTAEACCVVPS